MKPKVTRSAFTWWRILLAATILLGAALRLLRLSWQPLWWDEGYSIFFATEPLSTMVRLTAQDIHPPLYYTLLHFWFALFGNTGPEVARLFSVLIGVATLPVITWSCLILFPTRRWLALVATLLLAISPIHLYYSQEVRMYGLALLLTLIASTFLWQMQKELEQEQQPYVLAFGYVVAASLALLTLYYSGLILLAHQLWALIINRRHWRRATWFIAVALLILFVNLPWWLYAFPQLFDYIGDKVTADQDVALPFWSYITRHLVAFFAGHLPAPQPFLEIVRQTLVFLIALFIGTSLVIQKRDAHIVRWLLTLILIPFTIGYLINLIYPFFPDGGERLLLPILPYLLIFFALQCANLSATYRNLTVIALSLPILAAFIGTYIYFTTPRYTEHDYRPIVADVVTHSRPTDSILALFPWQVGYWRAYSPRTVDGTLLPPQPAPVDQTILRWNEDFAARLDQELENGTIWFPMPLSFGSTLPSAIEEYLQNQSRNLENHWYSRATRLTAWVYLGESPPSQPTEATYAEQVTLISSGVAPTSTTSANTPVAVDLCWQPPDARDDLRATLRLLDSDGHTWASRDLTPFAFYASLNPENPCLEAVAFNIPAGLPPNIYQLAIGVGPEDSEQLLKINNGEQSLTEIDQIMVIPPDEAISPHRLPVDHWLSPPLEDHGLTMLGNSGPKSETSLLAGDEVAFSLFLQAVQSQPPDRELYVSLQDRRGNSIFGWHGWPLPTYPPSKWEIEALAQAPISFYLPPDLPEGEYTLVAGFLDTTLGEKSIPATLAQVQVVRRPISTDAPATHFKVVPLTTFGTHANLVGYDLSQDGDTLYLSLTWQILQTLMPPHHIFVHLFDASGQRLAQSDGEPVTATDRAPTGSWMAGETLTTQHMLTLPRGAQLPFTIQAGLYLPSTGARLPVTVEGVTIGDSATITVTSEITP